MTTIDFNVAAWAAWSPERPDRDAWLKWAGCAAPPGAAEQPPPLSLRRRVTKLGQQALRAAWNLPASNRSRIIFASRDGEFSRTISVLDSLAQPEIVSPADFSLSVHHALAGLLSIARGNRAGHGAVAAGRDSLWYGIIEAAGCLNRSEEKTALLVYHSEPLPPPYDGFDSPAAETIALALEITSDPAVGLRLTPVPGASTCRDSNSGEALLRTLLVGHPATIQGERHTWHLARADAMA